MQSMMNLTTMVPTILMQIIFKEIIAKENSSLLKDHFQVFHKLKILTKPIFFCSATKEDFWRMAWEQRTPIIVALCQVVERGRIKCDHYWPYDNEPEYVSDIKLQMVINNLYDTIKSINNITILIKTRESTLPEWTEREFVLIKGEERREIKQVTFDLIISR